MSTRQFGPAELSKAERRSRRDRHLLSLSGGGYRGLFTATVLAAAEKVSVRPLASRFDMLAGTSIGGILAIGLTCGITAVSLTALIEEHGPAIFKPRRFSFAGLAQAHYSNAGLRGAITKILGTQNANRSFAEIPFPLIVTAVNERSSRPRIFRTHSASHGNGDDVSTLDVALATSAAPTFFPPHFIGGEAYLDGGLVANTPDLVLLTEAMRHFACSISECHLLSIGTAGVPRTGQVKGAPGKIGWVARHALIGLLMSAQEALSVEQVRTLNPGSYLRIDAKPINQIELDDVTDGTTQALRSLAYRAVDDVQAGQTAAWRRFLAHSSPED